MLDQAIYRLRQALIITLFKEHMLLPKRIMGRHY